MYHFAAFNYFVNTLIGLYKQLKHVLAFGTDGDKALIEALSHNFPFAIQLCCFLRFRKNVEQKLKDLGMPFFLIQEFIADIFGKHVGNTYQEGVVDSSSQQEFNQCLESLKELWDEREKPLAPVSGPRLYRYFVQYQMLCAIT